MDAGLEDTGASDMARIKVTTRLDIKTDILRLNAPKVKDEIGAAVVEEIRKVTARGGSPVKGQGRLAGYKNPDNYPGDRKQKRPVNLRLSEKMMRKLSFKRTTKGIGFSYPTDYAEFVNEGTPQMKARPFLPKDPGSEFIISIMRKILNIYSHALSDIVKGSKR